jgi:DNA polymerase III delta prime subunit
MDLDIHKNIYNKLKYFIEIKKIPNLIFHGPSGSGKRTLVNKFIKMVYDNDKEMIKSYVMYVNCAHGKGIKFIREELKFFAKTYINNGYFKSIILSNADKLTIDGQSALRRCIELFSHSTRFFIIVEDKYKLLKPILSRFCEIYVQLPTINGIATNLNKYHVEKTFESMQNKNKYNWLKKQIDTHLKLNHLNIGKDLFNISLTFYEKGYCALDLMNIIESLKIEDIKKYKILLTIHKIKKEFRNEKLLMLFILNMLFHDIEPVYVNKKVYNENNTYNKTDNLIKIENDILNNDDVHELNKYNVENISFM